MQGTREIKLVSFDCVAGLRNIKENPLFKLREHFF